ncbi:hypothetical protein PAXRUDRAFT_146529, partial [Paxillus rubicundulus Ve08.2h10]
PAIHSQMHNIIHPPLTLPTAVEALLIGVTGMDFESVRRGWSFLKHIIWSAQELLPSSQGVETFNLHGHHHGLGKSALFFIAWCYVLALGHSLSTQPLPTVAISAPAQYIPSTNTASECHQCYHHNYVVHKDSDSHIYYSGVPNTIQAASHFFIDSQVLEVFTNSKVFGWSIEMIQSPSLWLRSRN